MDEQQNTSNFNKSCQWIIEITSVWVAKKEQGGHLGVLLSESRRADSGGEDLGEGAASPLPTSEGIGEHCKLPSAPLNDFSVLQAAQNCCAFLGKQLQKSLNLAARGNGVRTMGTGLHCTPQVQDLYPLYPQVKDAAYVKILSKRL